MKLTINKLLASCLLIIVILILNSGNNVYATTAIARPKSSVTYGGHTMHTFTVTKDDGSTHTGICGNYNYGSPCGKSASTGNTNRCEYVEVETSNENAKKILCAAADKTITAGEAGVRITENDASGLSACTKTCTAYNTKKSYNDPSNKKKGALQPIFWLECSTAPTSTSTTLSSTSTVQVDGYEPETSSENSRKISSHNIVLTSSGDDAVEVSFYHTVSRTANTAITSVPYKTCNSNNCDPDVSRTLTGNRSGNLYPRTITIARGDTSGWSGDTYYIAPGDSKRLCEYIQFTPTVYTKTGSSGSGNEEVDWSSACVNVSRDEPSVTEADAEFTGEVIITPKTTYTYLDCSDSICRASRPGDYSFYRYYEISREDPDLGTIANTINYDTSDSSYPTTLNSTTSSIGLNSTWRSTVSEIKVTMSDSNQEETICGYLHYQNSVHYETTDGSTEEIGPRGESSDPDAYKCVTITFNPPSNQSQNFQASSSFLSDSSNLDSNLTWNNAKNAYIGKENIGSYTLKFSHQISSASPLNSNITENWRTNTYAVQQKISSATDYSDVSGYTGSNEKVNITKNHDYSLNISSNSKETYCERIKYKSSVSYTYGSLSASDRSYGSDAYSSAVCRDVIRPARASFEGRVKIVSTYNGDVRSSDDGETASFVGGGLRQTYGFQVVFEMKRTDEDGTPASTNSRFMTSYGSGSSQPTSYSGSKNYTFNDNNWHQIEITDTNTINIGIGTTTPVEYCAYLSYDTSADYYGSSTAEGRNFDGRKKLCVRITNPSLSYIASFSATSTATNPGLRERTDGTWEVTNYTYNSSTNTYSDGMNLPKTITVIFAHTLKRTDTGTPSFTFGDSGSGQASTRYKIQESTNGSSYSNIANSTNGITGTGTRNNFAKNDEQLLAAQHSFTFNVDNIGTITTYCQKIVYDLTTTYSTANNAGSSEGYSVNRDYSDYDGASTPKCITIRNPNWREFDGDNVIYPIEVIGSTIFGQNVFNEPDRNISKDSPRVTGATRNPDEDELNTFAFNANDVTINAYFEHQLERPVSNFVPASAGSFTVTPQDGARDNYVVTLEKPNINTSVSYSVDKLLRTDAGDTKIENINGTTTDPLSDGEKWNTITNNIDPGTANYGTSQTTFELLAGQTKTVCHKIVYGNYRYEVQYQEKYRQEYYGEGSPYNGIPWHYQTIQTTSPSSSFNNDSIKTDNAAPRCAKIHRPYNYKVTDITPNTSSNDLGYSDDEFNPTFTIDVARDDETKNYITDMNPDNTTISLFEIIVNKEQATQDAKLKSNWTSPVSTDKEICNSYSSLSNVKECNVIKSGEKPNSNVGQGVYNSNSYETSYTPTAITVPTTLDVGDKYCLSIGIKDESSSSSNWFISKSTCIAIAKKPTMQVWGGSVLANGGISTSISSKRDADDSSKLFHYGSWTDFALISLDKIKGMASGAGLSGGRSDSVFCDYSKLTIANALCVDSSTKILGNANNSRSLSEYYNKLKSKLTSQSILNDSSSEIHYSKDNIIISDDVQNNATNTIKQIVYITDKNILIDEKVTQIDAMLISKGTIYTCAKDIGGEIKGVETSDLDSDTCTNPLVINGPVYAKNLVLSRTYGADRDSLSDPAERFNFTPSTLIWEYNLSKKNTDPKTVYLKELSPRY